MCSGWSPWGLSPATSSERGHLGEGDTAVPPCVIQISGLWPITQALWAGLTPTNKAAGAKQPKASLLAAQSPDPPL